MAVKLVIGLGTLFSLLFIAAWFNRETIAENVIADTLKEYGVDARYEIASIGPEKQILHNIVVGDANSPDLVIDWAIVTIKPQFGFPRIDNIRLVRPRLYGSYRQNVFSFGSLDPVLFAESDKDFALPDVNIALEDAGLVLDTDYGTVAGHLSGKGNLAKRFRGELAGLVRGAAFADCRIGDASLYGQLAVTNHRPSFTGPIRLQKAQCAAGSARESRADLASVEEASLQLTIAGTPDFAYWQGEGALEAAALQGGGAAAETATADLRFSWKDAALTARYDATATNLAHEQAKAATLNVEGQLRSLRNFARMELTGSIKGQDIAPAAPFVAMVKDAKRAGAGSPMAPVITKMGRALLKEAEGSRAAAEYTVRLEDGRTSVVIPSASVQGGSGNKLLALSRLQLLFEGGTMREIAANFTTGGEDLPRLQGRMEQRGSAPATLNMAMAPYSAGSTLLAVPQLQLRSGAGGALQFAGEVHASGDVPGGRVNGLVLPVQGRWASQSGLVLGERCTAIAFDSARLAALSLGRQRLQICPLNGSPLLRFGAGGLRMAGQMPAIALRGAVGDSPLSLRSGRMAFAYPGLLSAQDIQVVLGAEGAENRFSLASLTAQLGGAAGPVNGPVNGPGVAGSFAGLDAMLAAVPLDIKRGQGAWRFADGQLDLSAAQFWVEDRGVTAAGTPRFEPLLARDAALRLANSVITTRSLLREPQSDAPVVRVDIGHDLASSNGWADLQVDALTFDRGLQPAQLTDMARGMVANVRGTLTGTGRIDWGVNRLTSRGRFATTGLDLAAPFGPVRGLSGVVVFTDLLNLTTAPNQELRLAAIDPGIEIFDGVVRYALKDSTQFTVSSAVWPLMGGTLRMEPLEMRFGESEMRRYSFQIEGLDAARVVSHMELNNIGASGLFDGTIPVVFDAEGNGRLEGGMLISRPPGGEVSYVGELTYEDLSPMANYAFSMLRALRYDAMSVQMDGPLAGDIVTKVRFDGVKQGEGAKQNFLTRKIAKLPIRFVLNIRAPFYSLMGSMRALYDPSAIRDPREIGLIDKEGGVLRRESSGLPALPPPHNETPLQKDAQ